MGINIVITRITPPLVVVAALLGFAATFAVAQPCQWSLVAQTGPGPRDVHTMAYDSGRGVIVLFGNWGSQTRGDTWEWDGREWTLAPIGGLRPYAGYGPAMVYDSDRGVCVLFSGEYEETWEYDGSEWTLVATGGPQRRHQVSMAYDSARRVTVLFGGSRTSESMYFGDTWEWDGMEWRQVANTGPEPRTATAMTYDQSRGVTILFGGSRVGVRYGDTWEWDGREWSRVAEVGPAPRSGPSMVYDPRHEVAILYGGSGGSFRFGDTWEWDGRGWAFLGESGPSPRSHQAMAFDSARRVAVLHGGQNRNFGVHEDTWELACSVVRLSADATCPGGGPIRVEWSGASAGGRAALLFADDKGEVVIGPGRPCAGTRLGLGRNRLQLVWQGRSGPDGRGSLRATAPRSACLGHLQLLDVDACATSNPVIVW